MKNRARRLSEIAAFLAASILWVTPAHAVDYRIDAAPLAINTFWSGFNLTFGDANNDGLFELSELIQFSGITIVDPNSTPQTFYYVVEVPSIAGIAEASGACLPSGYPPFGSWCFNTFAYREADLAASSLHEPTVVGGNPTDFSYVKTVVEVPEPETWALFALGLATLAWRGHGVPGQRVVPLHRMRSIGGGGGMA